MPRIIFPIFLLLALALALTGCAQPKPTLVVVVGGLGFSQLGDVKSAVAKECPDAEVVSAGGLDGYKSDLAKIIREKPHKHVVLVGHSFGASAIAKAAEQLPMVDLAVFIDPAWDDFILPKTVTHYLWFQRSNFGIERESNIANAVPKTIQGGHNDIPHSPELIAGIVNAINRIRPKPVEVTFDAPIPTTPRPAPLASR